MQKIPHGTPGYGELEWDKFVETSELFAGGDILATVKNALFDAVRKPGQVLTTEIVLSAIHDWRTAKDNIGQWGEPTVEIVHKAKGFSTLNEEKKDQVAK